MKRKIKLKGLVEKVDNNKVKIIVNYELLKPHKEKEVITLNIENCKNKEHFVENNFLKIKGESINDQKYVKTSKIKYILDNSYWSSPGATVAGGPHSTSDSTRRVSWKVIYYYYRNKFKK